jgi:pyruvate,water dikinase
MSLIVSFPGDQPASLAEVGAKACSLIRMAAAGLPVPPGVVLTSAFFAPWLDEIRASATWAALLDAAPEGQGNLCNALKERCRSLALEAVRRDALADVLEILAKRGDDVLLAVRSSSPEEDLDQASFAGGYETRLGVRPADLEDAVRHCFASSLDERVLVYKREHGFDLRSPRMAVVVQQQIASEVAGVGFSLDPLTNDYDEAVIDANWGLGESVVAGLASPDHFVVDKPSRQVVHQQRGAKQVSIWLGADGGTVERKGHRSEELTLSDSRLRELVDVMGRIEKLYETPIDIEWAYAGEQLHVLQARPITSYVPLAPEMLTRPGERRRLYVDAALSKGMTMNRPMSRLGLDVMHRMVSRFLADVIGIDDFTPAHGLVFQAGGRWYMNLSNLMRLGFRPTSMSSNTAATDALMAEIMSGVDAARYRAPTRPPWLRLRLLWAVPKLLWLGRRMLARTLWTFLAPRRAQRAYLQGIEAYERRVTGNLDYELPLEEFRQTYSESMTRNMFEVTFPALLAGLLSADPVVRPKTPEARALAEKLKLGFTGNLTVEMGIGLYRLARLLDRSDFEDLAELARRVETRQLPAQFLVGWDAFLSRFGCRGPLEMDLASPRYGDDPQLALRQMSFMAAGDGGFDPEAAHQRQVEARHRAYAELMDRSGWLRRVLLRRVFLLIDLFAGTRDTPKYYAVRFIHAMRKRALIEGRRLVEEGRLDAAEDVFDLTLDELASAAGDPSLNLRELREQGTRFLERVAAQVSEFPPVIDSRGRILRPPPRPETPGELRGMAVSPGVVTGPVKLLRDPNEKRVDEGDVLVAYTTDPGWTPLFVNAAAVVLEVGGILQHGAVIAREYGKPCVVGIDRVMTRLQDGQRVEVDGTEGVIRLAPEPTSVAGVRMAGEA